MSSKNLTIVKDLEFAARFAQAVGTSEPAEIERKYGLAYHTAKNYLEGRLPNAEKLKEIKTLTNVKIDWLLTGQGEMFASELKKSEPNFLEVFEDKIREIAREEIARTISNATPKGEIDAAKFSNPVPVVKASDV